MKRITLFSAARAAATAAGLLVASSPTSAPAQEPTSAQVKATLDLTRATIQADRKAIVKRYLKLTPAEEKAFWPVYAAYQKEVAVAGKRLGDTATKVAMGTGALTNAESSKILEDYLNNQKYVLDKRRTYVGRFSRVLPPKKVLRLYQLENKMDAAVQYELAGAVPLVGG